MSITLRLKALQASLGLKADGILGPVTMDAIEALAADAITQPQRPSAMPRAGFSPQWIVVHHNGVAGRTIEDIRRTHLAKGWNGVGYHKVIHEDGLVHAGRSERKPGAHAKGANDLSLAVCLIGNFNAAPPPSHMLRALDSVCRGWMHAYGIPADHVIGHREVPDRIPVAEPTTKLCPGAAFDLSAFRRTLAP